MLYTLNICNDVCQLGLNKMGRKTLPVHPHPCQGAGEKLEKGTLNNVLVSKSCWIHMMWWSHKTLAFGDRYER